jgi:hypothetical protein
VNFTLLVEARLLAVRLQHVEQPIRRERPGRAGGGARDLAEADLVLLDDLAAVRVAQREAAEVLVGALQLAGLRLEGLDLPRHLLLRRCRRRSPRCARPCGCAAAPTAAVAERLLGHLVEDVEQPALVVARDDQRVARVLQVEADLRRLLGEVPGVTAQPVEQRVQPQLRRAGRGWSLRLPGLRSGGKLGACSWSLLPFCSDHGASSRANGPNRSASSPRCTPSDTKSPPRRALTSICRCGPFLTTMPSTAVIDVAGASDQPSPPLRSR